MAPWLATRLACLPQSARWELLATGRRSKGWASKLRAKLRRFCMTENWRRPAMLAARRAARRAMMGDMMFFFVVVLLLM